MTTANVNQLVDHLFRHEAGKMVAVLTKVFGSGNIELAEDVVQDALTEAIENWSYKGIPDNPSAWLYRVAKNKALNILNREKYKHQHTATVLNENKSEPNTSIDFETIFSEVEIQDDMLKMLFTCCHPSISADSQIALALKTLCGFSIPEIAKAFLTTEENINKRLVRARQKIREDNIPFEVPQKDILNRLSTVLETIYLLFNEGYSASTGNEVVRYELCEEAIRLSYIITTSNAISNKETAYALLALMLLNASRFKARQNETGSILTMAEQDRSLWDEDMKAIGFYYLHEASQNNSISIYHILAAISAQYAIAPDYKSTDWGSILKLYDSLIQIDNSPLVMLNRAIVISKIHGAEQGLTELDKIQQSGFLKNYYLFFTTEAELYMQLKSYAKASMAIEKAIDLAPLGSEKQLLKEKLAFCKQNN